MCSGQVSWVLTLQLSTHRPGGGWVPDLSSHQARVCPPLPDLSVYPELEVTVASADQAPSAFPALGNSPGREQTWPQQASLGPGSSQSLLLMSVASAGGSHVHCAEKAEISQAGCCQNMAGGAGAWMVVTALHLCWRAWFVPRQLHV